MRPAATTPRDHDHQERQQRHPPKRLAIHTEERVNEIVVVRIAMGNCMAALTRSTNIGGPLFNSVANPRPRCE